MSTPEERRYSASSLDEKDVEKGHSAFIPLHPAYALYTDKRVQSMISASSPSPSSTTRT